MAKFLCSKLLSNFNLFFFQVLATFSSSNIRWKVCINHQILCTSTCAFEILDFLLTRESSVHIFFSVLILECWAKRTFMVKDMQRVAFSAIRIKYVPSTVRKGHSFIWGTSYLFNKRKIGNYPNLFKVLIS